MGSDQERLLPVLGVSGLGSGDEPGEALLVDDPLDPHRRAETRAEEQRDPQGRRCAFRHRRGVAAVGAEHADAAAGLHLPLEQRAPGSGEVVRIGGDGPGIALTPEAVCGRLAEREAVERAFGHAETLESGGARTADERAGTMRVAITGGTGFVGRHLADRFPASDVVTISRRTGVAIDDVDALARAF